MSYKVLLTKPAKKQLDKLPKEIQRKCLNLLHKLKENPDLGKRLLGDFSSYHSIRLQSYRVIYRKEDKVLRVIIISIRHRKDVYKKLHT